MVLAVLFSSLSGIHEETPSMVFAIAALFLHLASPPATAPATSGSQPVTTRSEATEVVSAPDSANTAHFNLDRVSLSNTATGSSGNSAPKLTAISLGSTENASTLSTVRIPEIHTGKPEGVTAAEIKPYKREWLALMVVEHGAAAFDAYSTRQAISRGAVEDDPFMRPFAHSGAIYAATQVGPVLFDLVARHMLRSENGFIRRMWWIPQTASAATSIFAGVHNLNVASHQ